MSSPLGSTPRISIITLAAAAACGSLWFSYWNQSSSGPQRSPFEAERVRAKAKAAALTTQLSFVENAGQIKGSAAFYTLSRDLTVTFSSNHIAFAFSDPPTTRPRPLLADSRPVRALPVSSQPAPPRHLLVQSFVDGRPDVTPIGRDVEPTRFSNLTGASADWLVDGHSYRELVYPDLWPGIDLVFSGSAGDLKYRFELKPGADPERIRLAYQGADDLRIAPDGALEIASGGRMFRDHAPIGWQESGSARQPVAAGYRLGGARDYGFEVASYDRSRTLILDPAIFSCATYIGGPGPDRGLGLAVDSTGAVYVTGTMFNVRTNSQDVYVGKLNPAGTAFDYLTLIGGAGDDEGFDIAIDTAGNAYVTGYTDSPNFPVLLGPDLAYNGGGDAFVLKLNPAGNALVYSGYFGGSGLDFTEGIAVDLAGNAYITGGTNSTQATFPVVVGPDLTQNGGFDCFVAKIKAVPNGPTPQSNLLFSGFIGGDQDDIAIYAGYIFASQIAVDSAGNAYISGMTKSGQNTFPNGNGFGSIPGFDHSQNGLYDAFVVKVRADGAGLLYATYIGGKNQDFAQGMAVDPAGNAYITGYTLSDQSSFPVRVGPDLTYNGGFDAYVAKLDPTGTQLLILGYIGGSGDEQGNGIDVDAQGNMYVVGSTASPNFPVVGGPLMKFNGRPPNSTVAFAVKVNALPNAPVVTQNFQFSTFIGGSGGDWAFWGRADRAGNLYVIGDTASTQSTFPTGQGFGAIPGVDHTFAGGGTDGFLVKISPN